MSVTDYILAYIVGFIVITVAGRLILRGEPTAHGQIVGRQIGCIVALLWPISLPYLTVFGIGAAIHKAWKSLRGQGSRRNDRHMR